MRSFFHKEQAHGKESGPVHGPRRRFWHKAHTDPFLSWTLILAAAVVVALALVGTGISVYLDSQARLSAPSTVTGRAARTPLNSQALEGVLRAFDARAKRSAAIRSGYSAPADPSLP